MPADPPFNPLQATGARARAARAPEQRGRRPRHHEADAQRQEGWNGPPANQRVVIEHPSPEVDGGRFPVKRCMGDRLLVEADIYVDGHDALRCLLLHRPPQGHGWAESAMQLLGNDRWQAGVPLTAMGLHEFAILAWADPLRTWREELSRWSEPADLIVALQVGAGLLRDMAARISASHPAAAARIADWAMSLLEDRQDLAARRELALDPQMHDLADAHADRGSATLLEPARRVLVEPPLARCSAWYEMFPRSAGRGIVHGTLRDCMARLPEIAAMGFDVLYLPPIHPIGVTRRKGPDNALHAGPADPGSPWAIGAAGGGHTAVHPALGTLADLQSLVAAGRACGVEVALDIAFQCSPDHPWVGEHPGWFRHRPDGSVQFAENPPKKYEDIYPFDFDTPDWRSLWEALKGVFGFWLAQGVRVFRVDNPHTKPFAFWEWLLGDLKRAHPEALFLAEAFTRPHPMHRLAKAGFTQSYTYFPWRNGKHEITAYFTELCHGPGREYLRPNAWPNTPDILTAFLQQGGRPAFMSRAVLAATLSANYGVYGPAFELCENRPRHAGSEEYQHSEKYQLRDWDRDRPDSIAWLLARLNAIRRTHPALQQDWRLEFHATDNDQLICYSKSTADLADVLLMVVNLHPREVHSGWVDLDLAALGIGAGPFIAEDLLTGARYTWEGPRNYVALDPAALPAHVLLIGHPGRGVTP